MEQIGCGLADALREGLRRNLRQIDDITLYLPLRKQTGDPVHGHGISRTQGEIRRREQEEFHVKQGRD